MCVCVFPSLQKQQIVVLAFLIHFVSLLLFISELRSFIVNVITERSFLFPKIFVRWFSVVSALLLVFLFLPPISVVS